MYMILNGIQYLSISLLVLFEVLCLTQLSGLTTTIPWQKLP